MALKAIDVLSELGLSKNEASVYHALLTLGPTSVLKISYETEIKRSTIYPIVNSLIEKGLVHTETRGVKQVFAAESPQKLETMMETRRKLLQQVLPELSALFYDLKGSDSFIKHYKGLDNILSLHWDMIKKLDPGDFYYVVSDEQKWRNLFPDRYYDFIEARAKKNLDLKILIEQSEYGRHFLSKKDDLKGKVKLLPSESRITTFMTVVPHQVTIVQTAPPYMAMTIENQSIITMNKVLFETIWDLAD